MARINILTYCSIVCLFVSAPVLGKVSDDVIYFPEAPGGIDSCEYEYTGARGKCLPLDDCAFAKDLLYPKINTLQFCAYNRSSPSVCCPSKTPFTGQRSEKQCVKNLMNFLNSDDDKIVGGGVRAKAKEFIHMALLGYGNKDDMQWLCGGSLISEQFVLTAAHCLLSTDFGPVRLVRLGELDIADSKECAKPQDFNVSKVFSHPEYQSSSHYNDIALIRLDRPAELDMYVIPACLYVRRHVSVNLTATGWGKIHFLDNTGSNYLMKVDLNPINHKVCANSYANASKRRLRNGIIDDLQICAGNPDGQDTCPGDSGGPLQFKDPKKILHYIVGVTSFGKACGIANSMGVYTRVASYVDWIEDIVWPLESKNMTR